MYTDDARKISKPSQVTHPSSLLQTRGPAGYCTPEQPAKLSAAELCDGQCLLPPSTREVSTRAQWWVGLFTASVIS